MKYFLILSFLFIVGCGNDKYDRRIVVDCIRHQTLILKHNVGDTYFIDTLEIDISGAMCKDSF